MDLNEIDLNLLVVFDQLIHEKRVSAVAVKLGLTQPAVSNALSRLRKMLGDDLFLRTSRGMEPTPYASRLAEPIAYALGTIRDTLNLRSDFNPATSTRKFTLAVTDIGEIYLLPRLMTELARIAPGVTISTVRGTTANLRDEIEAGHVDLAIGLLPQLKSGYFQRRLFRQRYVCMFRKGHALDKGKITAAEFAEAQHVVVVAEGTGHAKVDESIQRKKITRNIVLTVPHFVAVGHILSTTDMVATVPERYASACIEPFGLRYVPHPLPLPEIGINLFWHAKFHKEPDNQWLRSLISDTFAD
ncbi:LysR family transcriptional regulator [Lacisediminimonas profundi]|uniref:LysR family transcriptional regulator n=1 Tax=Lacisediminimonas profundi TaxID=2603856 RepID=UPI00124AFE3A|nr:LysR family transcriptional regulator [Lacisediminimonas profundi]